LPIAVSCRETSSLGDPISDEYMELSVERLTLEAVRPATRTQ